jgi:hypothetical protein
MVNDSEDKFASGWISSTIVSKILSEIDMSRNTFDKLISIVNSCSEVIEINEGKRGTSIKLKKDITIYIDK